MRLAFYIILRRDEGRARGSTHPREREIPVGHSHWLMCWHLCWRSRLSHTCSELWTTCAIWKHAFVTINSNNRVICHGAGPYESCCVHRAGSNLACVRPLSVLSFLHCQKRCIIILYLHYHSKVSSLKKKVSSACQGCIYLIKNTVKNIIFNFFIYFQM